jgi:hypothetical protein
VCAVIVGLVLLGGEARADLGQAIVIGSNASVDQELAPLRYADDDAVRFQDLFRTLGLRTHLLARLDEATSRLHPQASRQARPPTQGGLREVVEEVAAAAAAARARGEGTTLYVVFAGHGNVRRDRAYITLEDVRLYPEDLVREVVDVVAPGRAHVIIDACHSYLFAMSRGPGGTHRPVRGFLEESLQRGLEKVGFLVSSSQSGESHEWEAFQSGVFSHEVRSGLAGAADVDGDGTVSYREIAAFAVRANAAIVNESYRPAVYARAPRGSETLLDLRPVRSSRLRVDGKAAGKHFLVEDARGVRWVDFHSRQGQPITVLLPEAHRPLYVRSVEDGQESVVEPGAGDLVLADQAVRASAAGARGAAHHVFKSLFTLPFDRQAVSSFELQLEEEPEVAPAGQGRWRRYGAIAAFGVAAAGAAGGTYFLADSGRLRDSLPPGANQQQVIEQNARIERNDRNARWLFGGAAVAAAAGLLLWLWPSSDATVAMSAQDGGAGLQLTFRR